MGASDEHKALMAAKINFLANKVPAHENLVKFMGHIDGSTLARHLFPPNYSGPVKGLGYRGYYDFDVVQ